MLSNDSNFYVLSCYRLSRQETIKRLQILEDSITQLKAYHGKAKRVKKRGVAVLIFHYESLAERFREAK